jgi:hypothetical protein
MAGAVRSPGKLVTVGAGASAIVLGLVCNPVVVASVFSRSSWLPAELRLIVVTFDLILIVLGLTLIYFRNNRRAQVNLGLVSGSIVLSLAAAESTLRLFDFRPGELRLYAEARDGNGLFRLKPNLDITTYVGSEQVIIRTNSHGMRWREVSYHKLAGTKRIAFVGDSFTFGLWANRIENSFVGQVDAALAPRGVEVLNFGVPGYGLREAAALLREQVLRFEPDYVVLMFFNGNEFLDTYLGMERYGVSSAGVLQAQRDRIQAKIPEEFRISSPGHESGLNRLYLYRFVKYAVKWGWPAVADAMNRGEAAGPAVVTDASYRSDAFWSRTVYPPFAEAAKRMTIEALDDIRRLCEGSGIRLIVVTIPGIEQVYVPDAEFGPVYDRNRPQIFVRDFAETHGLAYLDLLPALRRYASEKNASLYFRNEGHFRTEGHAVVGSEIAAFLEREALR